MKLIRQLLQRRAQWERLYPKWYIDRHFTLYEGELEELLKMAFEMQQPPVIIV